MPRSTRVDFDILDGLDPTGRALLATDERVAAAPSSPPLTRTRPSTRAGIGSITISLQSELVSS